MYWSMEKEKYSTEKIKITTLEICKCNWTDEIHWSKQTKHKDFWKVDKYSVKEQYEYN